MSLNAVSFHVHVRFFVSCELPVRRDVVLIEERILGMRLCKESVNSHIHYRVSPYVKECD